MMTRRKARSAGWATLDRRNQAPIYRQIYERIRNAIAAGVIQPGQRLPSARSLAGQLAAARGTVDAAYSLLANEGYIIPRGAAGTFVAPALATLTAQRRLALSTTNEKKVQRKALETEMAGKPGPFQMGLPALDAFPRHIWSRLTISRARRFSAHDMNYPNPSGYTPLCEAIASHLAVARGISCSPEQVVITAGYRAAVGIIIRSLLKPGDKVWMEDPGYFYVRGALAAADMTIVPVPVDDNGMDVAAGIARSPDAKLAVVTPSHHAPLGVTLELQRRLALLSWAEKADAWILEDDYDGEFRYDSKPLPALKSLDRNGRVIYAGTFSKVLFPGLRLGYLVLPDTLTAAFVRMSDTFYGDSSLFTQAVVADFMADGHFARHMRRMRQLYAERRAALAEALDEIFKARFSLKLQAGGMHILAYLHGNDRDTAIAERTHAQGLGVIPLSLWRIKEDCGQGLLLSFTNIPKDSARREVRRLAQAIG